MAQDTGKRFTAPTRHTERSEESQTLHMRLESE